MGGSCHGAREHGPISIQQVGQSVDLPLEHDVGAMISEARPMAAALAPWSRPALATAGYRPTSRVLALAARPAEPGHGTGRRQERRGPALEPGRTRRAERAALMK